MNSEADLLGRKQTREMEEAGEARRGNELEAAQRLQHIATQLMDARGIEALYDQILDTVLAILASDFASFQMFYPKRGSAGELRLLGHRGFTAEAVKRWKWVTPTARTTCGEALRTRQRVAIEDVRNCDFMAGSEDLDGVGVVNEAFVRTRIETGKGRRIGAMRRSPPIRCQVRISRAAADVAVRIDHNPVRSMIAEDP
jgi:hypothetical protein